MHDIDSAREALKIREWEQPDSYGGYSPDGDYMAAGQSRDSSALERSNYARIFEDLQAEAAKHPEPDALDVERHPNKGGIDWDGNPLPDWVGRCKCGKSTGLWNHHVPDAFKCEHCGHVYDERGWVHDFRAGHWAVGWVEQIIVRRDAPDSVIIMLADIDAALEGYPVYDESHFRELEWTEATDYWSSLSVRDRAEYIRDTGCGASIFAARRGDMPQDDDGSLFEALTSC